MMPIRYAWVFARVLSCRVIYCPVWKGASTDVYIVVCSANTAVVQTMTTARPFFLFFIKTDDSLPRPIARPALDRR